MDKKDIEQYLSAFRGAESSFPFGPEVLVYKVMEKMYALVSQEENPARVTLKCIPEDGALLVSQFESIIPGYHMNKKHWITISITNELPKELLMDLMDTSYDMIVAKLTKKNQHLLRQL